MTDKTKYADTPKIEGAIVRAIKTLELVGSFSGSLALRHRAGNRVNLSDDNVSWHVEQFKTMVKQLLREVEGVK